MKLRQAKKILWSFNKKRYNRYRELRPEYYDEVRKCWVFPSFHDTELVRRAHTRMGRYWRNRKEDKK